MAATGNLAQTDFLRQLRQYAGLTVRQVAARAGISPGYLSRVERGLQQAPPATVMRVAWAIGELTAESI